MLIHSYETTMFIYVNRDLDGQFQVIGMKELKPIDYKLLFELMKDSHRSDRQIAKALGVSQPTVTRRRAMLEENYIDGYTVVPKFGQIGFEIAAFTFLKTKVEHLSSDERIKALQRLKDWYNKQPNVVLVQEGRGIGWDSVCVSLHETYSDYANFVRTHDSELADIVVESQTFQADLTPGVTIKPFNLKYLASLKMKEKKPSKSSRAVA
jgi:DNA-binding Lrp family transcriptional regulator